MRAATHDFLRLSRVSKQAHPRGIALGLKTPLTRISGRSGAYLDHLVGKVILPNAHGKCNEVIEEVSELERVFAGQIHQLIPHLLLHLKDRY